MLCCWLTPSGEVALPGAVGCQGCSDRRRRAGFHALEALPGQHGRRAGVELADGTEGDQGAQVGVRFAAARADRRRPDRASRSLDRRQVSPPRRTGATRPARQHRHLPAAVLRSRQAGHRAPDRRYRVLTLDTARRNAESAGLRGARYAWPSAASGEDVTPSFVIGPGGRRSLLQVLTGHREIHVVADAARAIETLTAHVRRRGVPRRRRRRRGDLQARGAALLREPGRPRRPRGLEIHDGNGSISSTMSRWRTADSPMRWRRGRCAGPPTWPIPGTPRPSPASPPQQWRSAADRTGRASCGQTMGSSRSTRDSWSCRCPFSRTSGPVPATSSPGSATAWSGATSSRPTS